MSAVVRVDPPAAIDAVARRLEKKGIDAWLVGSCLRKLLGGLESRDFEILCAAPLATLVEIFDRAIPIPRSAVVVLPTPAGVCELRPLVEADGAAATLEQSLADRGVSIDAIAWDLHRRVFCDPFHGRKDLGDRRLRGVGDTEAGFRQHPLRLLRMGRLVATLGFTATEELRNAMRAAAPVLADTAKPPLRRELTALLLADHAGAGLRLLRETEVEVQLAPACHRLPRDARTDAWVDALPRKLPLRLAAWLDGTDPQIAMGPLRFGEALSAQVARLIARHPLDGGREEVSLGSVRRLLTRAGEDVVRDLLVLRGAQFAATGDPAPATLQTIRDHLETARHEAAPMLGRRDLALSGREIMTLLDIPPGPRVGEVINWLIAEVERDPAKNSAAALRALLDNSECETT